MVQAFNRFKEQGKAQGVIGLVVVGMWCEPYDPNNKEDVAAAERCLEWQTGLFFDPVFFGDYPLSMRSYVGSRLPEFTMDEWWAVKGSHTNVFYQNQYSSMWVQYSPEQKAKDCGYNCDGAYNTTQRRLDSNIPIGPQSPANTWLYSHGVGFRQYQKWISDRYRNPQTNKSVSIIVTENGWGEPDSFGQATNLQDVRRCNYVREHVGNMSLAANVDGVDIAGYFTWSLMDNFELSEGYSTRFGMVYVDYATQQRTPKLSFKWFAQHVTPLKKLPADGVLPECPTSDESLMPLQI